MSSLVRATPEQWDQLNALGSTYLLNVTMRGQVQVYIIDLIDKVTQNPWHSGQGETPQQALNNAIETATRSSRPKTQAELAAEHASIEQENEKLREEVAMYRAAQSNAPKRKPTETT
jgi:hypothetical protein